MQSYKRAIVSSRREETCTSLEHYGKAFVGQPDFLRGLFSAGGRTIQLQGSPAEVPFLPPSSEIAISISILVGFQHNYTADLSAGNTIAASKVARQNLHKPPNHCLPQLASLRLLLWITSKILSLSQSMVSVPQPFPTQAVVRWTLQVQPAWVQQIGEHYQIEPDLLRCCLSCVALPFGSVVACLSDRSCPTSSSNLMSKTWN